MLANILLAASAFSLAYTVWMIYQNITQTVQQSALTPSAPTESSVTPATGNAKWKNNHHN
jgi:hypothetical protein